MENILQDCQSRDGEQYGAEFLISQLNHISAPLARNMLHKIGLNETVTDPFHVLELGCGIGVVAPLLNETVPREVLEMSKVLCADASERLVGAVNGRIEKEGWVGAEARVVDAQVGFSPPSSFFLISPFPTPVDDASYGGRTRLGTYLVGLRTAEYWSRDGQFHTCGLQHRLPYRHGFGGRSERCVLTT